MPRAVSVIGGFFGLYLDTRHIAFATANFGISFSTGGSGIPPEVIVHTVVSISIIGFLNFLVSFGLAMLVTGAAMTAATG